MSERAFISILCLLLMVSPSFAAGQSKLDTQDLIVIFDAGLERSAQQALAQYPAIKQALENVFKWPLKFQPTLVLLHDKAHFRRLAGHELVVAYALPSKNVVVIDHSKMHTSPFTLLTTFKHELCHLLLHHYIRDDNLPRWLDEGICQWASDGLADIIMDTKRDLLPAAILSETYFDLETLHDQFPREKNALRLAYAQSKSVVEYLNSEYGSQGILDFLEEFNTVHARHFDIGQNNLRFGSLKNFKGRFAVFCGQHLIAAVCQRYAEDFANACLVIRQQYFFIHDVSPRCEV